MKNYEIAVDERLNEIEYRLELLEDDNDEKFLSLDLNRSEILDDINNKIEKQNCIIKSISCVVIVSILINIIKYMFRRK